MFFFRVLLVPLAVGTGLVLAVAMGQQTSPPPKAAPPAPPATAKTDPAPAPAKADPEATRFLDEAVERSKKWPWLETTLWQQMDLQGLTFQAEGTYLAGPEHRLRLDLKVHIGGRTGRLEMISDGSTLWEILQLGKEEERALRKVDVKKVLASLDNPSNTPDVIQEVQKQFFQNHSFAGLAPLLQSIQQRLVMTKKEDTLWNGMKVILLTGAWQADAVNAITQSNKQPWPAYLPRQCRLFLDADTRWPYRVEWWGPVPSLSGDRLLVQMEFRKPKHEPLSPEQAAQAFTFKPGAGEVQDQTKAMTDLITNQAKQLTAQKTPRPPTPGKAPPK